MGSGPGAVWWPLCTVAEAWSGLVTTAVAGTRDGAKNLCSNAQEVSFMPNFSSAVRNSITKLSKIELKGNRICHPKICRYGIKINLS